MLKTKPVFRSAAEPDGLRCQFGCCNGNSIRQTRLKKKLGLRPCMIVVPGTGIAEVNYGEQSSGTAMAQACPDGADAHVAAVKVFKQALTSRGHIEAYGAASGGEQ